MTLNFERVKISTGKPFLLKLPKNTGNERKHRKHENRKSIKSVNLFGSNSLKRKRVPIDPLSSLFFCLITSGALT
jgi:hypothetical protein